MASSALIECSINENEIKWYVCWMHDMMELIFLFRQLFAAPIFARFPFYWRHYSFWKDSFKNVHNLIPLKFVQILINKQCIVIHEADFVMQKMKRNGTEWNGTERNETKRWTVFRYATINDGSKFQAFGFKILSNSSHLCWSTFQMYSK